MKKTIRAYIIFTASLILLMSTGTLFAEEDDGATLRWKNIAGAAGYKIEIRNDRGAVIHRETLTNPVITLNLPTGTYQGRVAALNKFKKPGKWSTWFNFNIRRSLKPSFDSLSPGQFSPEDPVTEIKVRGGNFMEGVSVSLRSGSSIIAPEILPGQKKDTLAFRLDPSVTAGGSYDLIITNPGNNSITAQKVLQITATPLFRDISPSSIRDTVEKQNITITGKRYMKDVEISLQKGEDIVKPEQVVHHSLDEVSFTLFPARMKPGSYDLIISNPGDNRETIHNALHIKTFYGLTLGAGGFYSYILPKWDSLLNGSYSGGEFYAGYQPSLFGDIPFVKNMGFEFRAMFVQYSATKSGQEDMRAIRTGIGIFYNIQLHDMISLIVRTGGGNSSSILLQSNNNSTDPFIYAGLSFRFTLGTYFFIEPGTDFHYIIYLGQAMKTVHPFLRAGVLF